MIDRLPRIWQASDNGIKPYDYTVYSLDTEPDIDDDAIVVTPQWVINVLGFDPIKEFGKDAPQLRHPDDLPLINSTTDAFKELEHPRGQPKNAGEFAKGSGKGKSTKPVRKASGNPGLLKSMSKPEVLVDATLVNVPNVVHPPTQVVKADFTNQYDSVNIKFAFPRLKFKNLQLVSGRDRQYNCVADACGDSKRWWWPDTTKGTFWPKNMIGKNELDSFDLLFISKLKGTELHPGKSNYSDPEKGYIKLALFEDSDGKPAHLARILPDGKYLSKMGQSFVITHPLFDVENGMYGNLAKIYKVRTEQWMKLKDMK